MDYLKRCNKEKLFCGMISFIYSVLWVIGTYDTVNFSGKGLILVCGLRFFLYSILFYLIVCFFWNKIKVLDIMDEGIRKFDKKVYWIIFGICFGSWLVYFLTLYPGVVTNDSRWQISQAVGIDIYSNHHPWIQTMLIKFFCDIGNTLGSLNFGVALYTVFQMCVIAAIYSYVMHYLYQKGVKKFYLFLCILFYAFFPINAFYAVTMWKDILAGAMVLLFSVELWKIEQGDDSKIDWFIFFVSGILLSLLRNNMFYAYLLCIPFIIFFIKRKRVLITFIGIISVIICFFVKGPLMDFYGVVPPDTIEGLSIPAQHIARTITEGAPVTNEQIELLGHIVDVEKIPETYNCHISDPIKELVRETDNQEYIKKHKDKFLKLWFDLGIQYPTCYLKAQIDQTKGFWLPGVQYWVTSTEIVDNDLGVERQSKMPSFCMGLLTRIESVSYELPIISWFWGIGIYTWIAIGMFIVAIYKKQKVLAFLPSFAIIASLMIATPVFAEFRYAYFIVLLTPIFIAIGCGKNKESCNSDDVVVQENLKLKEPITEEK